MFETNISCTSLSHSEEENSFENDSNQSIYRRLTGNKIKPTSPYIMNDCKLKIYTPFKMKNAPKKPTHPNLVLLGSGINLRKLTENTLYTTIEEENELASYRNNSPVGNINILNNARSKNKKEIDEELMDKTNSCSGNVSSSSSDVFQQKADSRKKCNEIFSPSRLCKGEMESLGRFARDRGASASESSFTNVKVIHPPKHETQCAGDFSSRSIEFSNVNEQNLTKQLKKQPILHKSFNGKTRKNNIIDIDVTVSQKTIKNKSSNSLKTNKRKKNLKTDNKLEEPLQRKIRKEKKNVVNISEYPLLISEENEACGSIQVVPSPSQFSGLESQIWPFMVNWLPQKKRKGILNNSLNVKSSHKLNTKGPTKQLNNKSFALSKHCQKTRDNITFDNYKATLNIERMNKTAINTSLSFHNPLNKESVNKGITDNISSESNIEPEVIDIDHLLKYVSNGIYGTDEDLPKATKDIMIDSHSSNRKILKAETDTKRIRNGCLSKKNDPIKSSKTKLVQPQNHKSLTLNEILEKIRHGVYFNDPDDNNMNSKANRHLHLSQNTLAERTGKINVSYIAKKEKTNKRKQNKHKVYTQDEIKSVKIPGFRNPLSSFLESLSAEFVFIKDTKINAEIKFEIEHINVPSQNDDEVSPLIDSFHVSENNFLKCTATLKLSVALLPAQLCSILPKIVNEIENNRDTVYKYVPKRNEDPKDTKEASTKKICICLPRNAPLVKPVSRSLPDIIQPNKSQEYNSLCTNLSVSASYEQSLPNNESVEITQLPHPLDNLLPLSDEYSLNNLSATTDNNKCLEESNWKQVSVSERICKTTINYNAIAVKSEMNYVSSSLLMVDKVNNTDEYLSVKYIYTLSLYYKMYSTLFRLTRVFKIYLILTSYMRRGYNRMICGINQCSQRKSQHVTYTKNLNMKNIVHNFRAITGMSQYNDNYTTNGHVAGSDIDTYAIMRAYKIRRNKIETQRLTTVDDLLDFLCCESHSDIFNTIGNPQKDNIKFAMFELKKKTKVVTKSQVLLIFLICTRFSYLKGNESLQAALIDAILDGSIKTTQDLNKRCRSLEFPEKITEPSKLAISKKDSANEVKQNLDREHNPVLEELYNIAISTALGRKLPVDEHIMEELEQLLKKNPYANLSYLRVMARYAGLGLLKKRSVTSSNTYF